VLDTEAESEVRIEAGLIALRFEIGEKSFFILGRVRCVY
jgi:hypothetical protein